MAKVPFVLQVDEESCLGCGLCWGNCNVGAIEPGGANGEKIARVSEQKCLGCGACISACPTGSLSLAPVERPLPPDRKRDLFTRILKEKKRFSPYVVETVKTTILRKIGRG